MENNEKKIDTVELNDKNLEKVSGGGVDVAYLSQVCSVCGRITPLFEKKDDGKFYCPDCGEKAGF